MGVDSGAGGGIDSLDGGGELLARHRAPDCNPHRGQPTCWRVEQDLHGVAELLGGQVECWQGPQPFPGASTVGAGKDATQELVEQIQCVVAGRDLQVPRRREQRRNPTLLTHPGHRLRLRGGGVAGERLQPAGWHKPQVEAADVEGAGLLQSVQCAQQPGGGDAGRSAPQPIQRRGPLTRWDDEQTLEPGSLPGVGHRGESLPQPGRGLVANRGDQPGQHSGAGQQHLRLEQPCGGQVEQHAGPLTGQPRPGLEPADQVLLRCGVGEVAVPVSVLDLPGVQTVRSFTGRVLLEHTGVGYAQLGSDMRPDHPRHVGRVGQERAEEPDSSDLDGEPETVVLTTTDVHELAVGGVEVEVAV